MFILNLLRKFKAVRLLDKYPFKIGLRIGTPPSSAMPNYVFNILFDDSIVFVDFSMFNIFLIYLMGLIDLF